MGKIKTTLFTALALSLVVQSAYAAGGDIYTSSVAIDTRNQQLPACEGTVTAVQTAEGQPQLTFRDVGYCSRFDILEVNGSEVTYAEVELQGDKPRYGSYTLPKAFLRNGQNSALVVVQSTSKKTRDLLRLNFWVGPRGPAVNATMTIGDVFALPTCRGTVKVTKSQNNSGDQLNIVFSQVQNCSKFDILSSNGESVSYEEKSLQRNSQGSFSGSFTIPARFIDWLSNSILVRIKSNSGATDEVIRVRFVVI